MKDILIFLKYIFNISGLFNEQYKKMKRWVKRPLNISYVLMIFSVFLLVYHRNDRQRWFLPTILLILAFLIQIYVLYKSGAHRYWYKKKQGKVYLKELKTNRK